MSKIKLEQKIRNYLISSHFLQQLKKNFYTFGKDVDIALKLYRKGITNELLFEILDIIEENEKEMSREFSVYYDMYFLVGYSRSNSKLKAKLLEKLKKLENYD